MLDGVKLTRIDYRLIHGQVITKWTNKAAANRIIVVNDELAKDKFMASCKSIFESGFITR